MFIVQSITGYSLCVREPKAKMVSFINRQNFKSIEAANAAISIAEKQGFKKDHFLIFKIEKVQ